MKRCLYKLLGGEKNKIKMGQLNQTQRKPRSDVLDKHFNNYLRTARLKKGYSIRELSEKVGIHYLSIREYERLFSFPSSQQITEKIASVLDKKLNEIFPRKVKIITRMLKKLRKTHQDHFLYKEDLFKIPEEALYIIEEDFKKDKPNIEQQLSFILEKNIKRNLINHDDTQYSEKLREELRKALERLPEKERDIIEMRFGLNNNECCTLKETRDKHGYTKQGIKYIQDNALKKLRRILKSRGFRTLEDRVV